MILYEWDAHGNPGKCAHLYAFVFYRRLSPQFHLSLSGVTLVYPSQWLKVGCPLSVAVPERRWGDHPYIQYCNCIMYSVQTIFHVARWESNIGQRSKDDSKNFVHF